jgi:hypothetical protein
MRDLAWDLTYMPAHLLSMKTSLWTTLLIMELWVTPHRVHIYTNSLSAKFIIAMSK